MRLRVEIRPSEEEMGPVCAAAGSAGGGKGRLCIGEEKIKVRLRIGLEDRIIYGVGWLMGFGLDWVSG